LALQQPQPQPPHDTPRHRWRPAAACRCREQAGTPQNRTARVHTQEEHDRHGEWPAGHALLATQVNNSIINILRAIRLLISFLCF